MARGGGVFEWKLELLESLGFAPRDALTLARWNVDIWFVSERLLKRGCPHTLVLRIVAPLEGPDGVSLNLAARRELRA